MMDYPIGQEVLVLGLPDRKFMVMCLAKDHAMAWGAFLLEAKSEKDMTAVDYTCLIIFVSYFELIPIFDLVTKRKDDEEAPYLFSDCRVLNFLFEISFSFCKKYYGSLHRIRLQQPFQRKKIAAWTMSRALSNTGHDGWRSEELPCENMLYDSRFEWGEETSWCKPHVEIEKQQVKTVQKRNIRGDKSIVVKSTVGKLGKAAIDKSAVGKYTLGKSTVVKPTKPTPPPIELIEPDQATPSIPGRTRRQLTPRVPGDSEVREEAASAKKQKKDVDPSLESKELMEQLRKSQVIMNDARKEMEKKKPEYETSLAELHQQKLDFEQRMAATPSNTMLQHSGASTLPQSDPLLVPSIPQPTPQYTVVPVVPPPLFNAPPMGQPHIQYEQQQQHLFGYSSPPESAAGFTGRHNNFPSQFSLSPGSIMMQPQIMYHQVQQQNLLNMELQRMRTEMNMEQNLTRQSVQFENRATQLQMQQMQQSNHFLAMQGGLLPLPPSHGMFRASTSYSTQSPYLTLPPYGQQLPLPPPPSPPQTLSLIMEWVVPNLINLD